jgi:hypothetical protein
MNSYINSIEDRKAEYNPVMHLFSANYIPRLYLLRLMQGHREKASEVIEIEMK